MRNSLLIGLAIALLTSCAPMPPVRMANSFDPSQHAIYAQEGSGSIKGQGFLRQRGGGTVTCAGSEVLLFPNTPFFQEAIGILRRGGTPDVALGSIDLRFARRSQCDVQGNFSFNSLPAANWFVLTDVKWMAGNSSQGGTLGKDIQVRSEQTVDLLLTDKNFMGR